MNGRGPGGAGKPRNRKTKGRGSGNRRFVTSAEELAQRDVIEERRQEARRKRRDEEGEEGDDKEEDEDDDEEEEEELMEEGEEKVVKPKGVAGLIDIQNPNAVKPQQKTIKAKDMDANFEQKLSRREREAIEKERRAADYKRRHLAGQTAEAKKDLARLEIVRKQRVEAEKLRKDEEDAEKERNQRKKKSSSKTVDEDLDLRTIKAMKPNVLKEKLKERGLSIQGQKKDLIQRLIDFENEKAL